jgi:integrase/recombinase XerD
MDSAVCSGSLDPSQVARLVRAAAKRAGIKLQVSSYWMRHAHASHALDSRRAD